MIHRIFDPFFTTKENGTGLGLTKTKRIIEQLDGHIQIKSKIGKGTKIEFVLPIS